MDLLRCQMVALDRRVHSPLAQWAALRAMLRYAVGNPDFGNPTFTCLAGSRRATTDFAHPGYDANAAFRRQKLVGWAVLYESDICLLHRSRFGKKRPRSTCDQCEAIPRRFRKRASDRESFFVLGESVDLPQQRRQALRERLQRQRLFVKNRSRKSTLRNAHSH